MLKNTIYFQKNKKAKGEYYLVKQIVSMDAVTKKVGIQWADEAQAKEMGLPNHVPVDVLTPNCLELLEAARKEVDEQVSRKLAEEEIRLNRKRKSAPDINSIELIERGEKVRANERLRLLGFAALNDNSDVEVDG